MHAWPVHGNGVTKGAAHVLGGPANMSKKVMVGVMLGQHDAQSRGRRLGVKTREHHSLRVRSK